MRNELVILFGIVVMVVAVILVCGALAIVIGA
jgi:hypothetical protein